MNFFGPDAAAERYAIGRPRFHRDTIARIKHELGVTGKFERALDIACGTGFSTEALLDIAVEVKGTDASEAMLQLALAPDKIEYSVALAESQPFPSNHFDLVTVSSGVHWFNIDQFLFEAHRLLKTGSWLVLYDNFFISEMKGVAEFSKWYPEVYLAKFPAPARNSDYDWSQRNLSKINFVLAAEKNFKNEVAFTRKELVMYFTTQSNIAAAVTRGEVTYEAAEAWLNLQLLPYFSGEESRILYFGNWIKYLRSL